jgi:hypothetical protein
VAGGADVIERADVVSGAVTVARDGLAHVADGWWLPFLSRLICPAAGVVTVRMHQLAVTLPSGTVGDITGRNRGG